MREIEKYRLDIAEIMLHRDKTCALLPIIKDHLDPLMKLFKKELKNEYSLNDLTKCLYTAVLVLSIYMGEFSLSHIRKCDVDHVQTHYAEMQKAAQIRNPSSQFDPSLLFVRDARKSILSKSSSRYLYYIMMTNADVSLPGANSSTIMFPGHVCVIEKFPNSKYHIYQSYINKYDLKGHYDLNKGSFAVSQDVIKNIFDQIEKLYLNGIWTKETSAMWKTFTHVDGAPFEQHDFKGHSFFCYRKIPIKTCSSRLIKIINVATKQNDATFDQSTKDELIKLKKTLNEAVFSS